MNSKEILWPDKQLTDQIQKAKEIQRRTLSRRPLWSIAICSHFPRNIWTLLTQPASHFVDNLENAHFTHLSKANCMFYWFGIN